MGDIDEKLSGDTAGITLIVIDANTWGAWFFQLWGQPHRETCLRHRKKKKENSFFFLCDIHLQMKDKEYCDSQPGHLHTGNFFADTWSFIKQNGGQVRFTGNWKPKLFLTFLKTKGGKISQYSTMGGTLVCCVEKGPRRTCALSTAGHLRRQVNFMLSETWRTPTPTPLQIESLFCHHLPIPLWERIQFWSHSEPINL